MSSPPTAPADVSDEAGVLAANGAFYAAFAAGDFAAMDGLWARQAPVACVHPGWPPMQGREKVIDAWRGILQNPPRPAIRSFDEHVMMLDNVGVVIGFEMIGEVTLVATNIFVREDGAWKMVHHQAAITDPMPRATGTDAPRSLH
jgi:ketosteroid isomerase-like protein